VPEPAAADRDAIHRVKYRYLRGVDTKDWALLASTLTEDAVARYGGGVHTVAGRDAIVAFLRSRLEPDSVHTAHRVNHPELDATDDPARVTGRWTLDDVVIDSTQRFQLVGAAWYEDVYRRTPDGWRIAETGYRRTFELISQLPEGAVLTASAWQTDGRTTLPY
jgi:ketosteroid isomerase-like protein